MTLNGLDTYDRFRRALTHVRDDHADAARIVISGDLTHWADPAAYQRLKTAIADSPVPIRLLIGNHDARAPFRAAFPDHPCDPNGYINYAETLGHARLIYLDTTEPLTHAGHFCAQRRGWLDAELATLAPTQEALLFCHHNPLDLGAPAEDLIALNPKDQAALRDILRRHRTRIRLIAFGHVHTPLCGTMEGIPFSGTPSTAVQGIPDLAPGDQLKGALMEPSYRVILRRGVDTVIHQIPFAWDGPVTTSGTGWQDWAKPEA